MLIHVFLFIVTLPFSVESDVTWVEAVLFVLMGGVLSADFNVTFGVTAFTKNMFYVLDFPLID